MSDGDQLYPSANERDENTLFFDAFNGGNFLDAFRNLVDTARRNSSNSLPSLELIGLTPPAAGSPLELANRSTITHENGNYAVLENGKPVEVKVGDMTFKRIDNKWVLNQGDKMSFFNGDVRVDQKNGDITLRRNDGATTAYHKDGSISLTLKNGDYAKIVNGNPVEVKLGDLTLSRTGGSQWNASRKDQGSSSFDGAVSVDLRKAIIALSGEKGEKTVRTAWPDGAQVTTDSNMRVIEVAHPDRKSWLFERADDGTITKVTMPNGTVMKRLDEKTGGGLPLWSVEKDGKQIGTKFANYDVKADGAVVESTPRGDTTFKRDGTEVRNKQNEKGEIVGREEKNPDKSVATYDKEGRIVRVQMANGEWRRFDRDEQGRVTKITESNGVQWNSKDGKTFQLSGSNNQIRGDLEINKDGSYVFFLKEGEVKRNTDNSMSLIDGLGQERVRFYDNGARIGRDENGNITETRDAQGRERRFVWESGKLKSLQDPDGKIWDRVDSQGKQWRQRGSDKIRQGEVKVEADGSYTVKNGSGSSFSFRLDGSTISRDSKGQIDAIQDSLGRVRRFHRDEQGKINSVREPDGSIWTLKAKDKTSAGNDVWKKEGSESIWKGKIEVDERTGVYKETSAGCQTIKSPDAWVKTIDKDGNTTLERENPDGSKVKKNGSGQITELTDAAGHCYKIEYDGNGGIARVQGPKETLLARDGKIEVGENAIIRQKLNGGGEKILKSDGSVVTKDAQQRVVSVLCANGKGHLFEYDANGISKMTEIDRKGQKTEWVKVGAHEWSKDGGKTKSFFDVRVLPGGTVEEFFPGSSNKTAYGTDGSEIKVNKKGAVLYTENGKGDLMRYQIDENGEQRRNRAGEPLLEKAWKADQSIVEYNKQGLISAVQDKNGVKREFKYDKDGKLNFVKDEFGTYRRDDRNASPQAGTRAATQKWLRDDGRSWEGRVEVNQSTGTYSYFDKKSRTLVENYSDGHKERSIIFERPDARGAYGLVEDDKGRLREIRNANGEKYELQYDSNNQLTKITNGKLNYERKGDHWECSDGKRYENIEVDKNGILKFTDSEKVRFVKPDGRPDVDVHNSAVELAVNELGRQYHGGAWSSDSEVLRILQNKSPEMIQAIEKAYNAKYEPDLRSTINKRFGNNENKEKALAILNKRDDQENNAGRILIALKEMESYTGRSQKALELDIRQTIKVMNREEIRQLSEKYRQDTNGRDLYTDLLNNKYISAETKLALGVYWSGSDNRNEKDVLNVAYKAIEAGNLDLFKEVISLASPETRKRFLDYGGKNKLEEKFGGSWLAPLGWLVTGALDTNGSVRDMLGIPRRWSDDDFLDAVDFAKHGKLSVERQVGKNTRWFGDDVEAIENGLKQMTPQERQAYRNGVFMTQKQEQSLPVSYSESRHIFETPAIAGNYVTVDQSGQQVITVENVKKMLSDKFVLMDPLQRQAWEDLLKHPGQYINSQGAFTLEQLRRKERDDFQIYAAVRNNLYAAAGNFLSPDSVKAEMAKWEYMAMNEGGHQLVKDLNSHVGKVYSSTKQKLLGTIENISKADWLYLKNHPEAQAKVREILDCLPPEKTNAAREGFRRKMSAATFEEAERLQRGVVEKIRDNTFTFSQTDRLQTDRAKVYEAIEHMSQDEKDRYARGKKDGANEADIEFANSVDKAVKDAFGWTAPKAALDVAEGMLRNIAKNPNGEVLGLTELVKKYQADPSLKKTELIRELQRRIKKDPELLKRLQDPTSVEHRSLYSELGALFPVSQVKAVVPRVSEDWIKMKRLVDPMLRDGAPPLALQLQYDYEARDLKGFMQDIANASKEERDKFRSDPARQREAFHGLFTQEEEREKTVKNTAPGLQKQIGEETELAKNIAEQGAIKPEDHLRAYVLGWEKAGDALKVLANLEPGERSKVEAAYIKKYGSSLLGDLEDQMSKADFGIARERLMPEPLSDMEAYNRSRARFYESGFGLGPELIKATGWDGTVEQAWDAVNRYSKAMSAAHAEGRQMTKEEQAVYKQQVKDTLEALVKSKESFAERFTEAAITMAAIGVTVGSGGTAGPMAIGAVVGLSAAFKVAANRAILGEDYEGTLKQVLGDAFSGGLSALLNLIGPNELGKMIGLGNAVAKRAVGTVIGQLEKDALKISAEQVEKETAAIVRHGILSGAKEFDQKAILDLAKKAVGPDKAEKFAKALMASLSDATKIESRSFVQRQFTAYGATAITGSAASGTANLAGAIIKSDFKRESPAEILERAGGAFLDGAIVGAPMAVGFHASFHLLGAGWRGVRLAKDRIVSESPKVLSRPHSGEGGHPTSRPELAEATVGRGKNVEPQRDLKPEGVKFRLNEADFEAAKKALQDSEGLSPKLKHLQELHEISKAWMNENFEDALKLAMDMPANQRIEFQEVTFDMDRYMRQGSAGKTQQLENFLRNMSEKGRVDLKSGVAVLPFPVFVVNGERIALLDATGILNPQAFERLQRITHGRFSPEFKRVLAEQALIAMEERLHLKQAALGNEAFSPSYKRFLNDMNLEEPSAGNGRLSRALEQETILALHDAGWPTDLLEHHFGGCHQEARRPVFEWLKVQDAMVNIKDPDIREVIFGEVKNASGDVRASLIKNLPDIIAGPEENLLAKIVACGEVIRACDPKSARVEDLWSALESLNRLKTNEPTIELAPYYKVVAKALEKIESFDISSIPDGKDARTVFQERFKTLEKIEAEIKRNIGAKSFSEVEGVLVNAKNACAAAELKTRGGYKSVEVLDSNGDTRVFKVTNRNNEESYVIQKRNIPPTKKNPEGMIEIKVVDGCKSGERLGSLAGYERIFQGHLAMVEPEKINATGGYDSTRSGSVRYEKHMDGVPIYRIGGGDTPRTFFTIKKNAAGENEIQIVKRTIYKPEEGRFLNSSK